MTLILGGSGQLGTAFRHLMPDATAPTRRELDLSDIGAIRQNVISRRPDRIINCAAYTAVDAAETDELGANLINRDAVAELAQGARELSIPLLTFSTDYVFEGSERHDHVESSAVRPLNVYGRSKLAGEERALGYRGALVVRTSWLVSGTHRNFITTILNRAANGEVSVVDDQWGRPTVAEDLAAASLAALRDGMTGLAHMANPPTTTWFGLACTAAGLAGVRTERIKACSTADFEVAALRPEHAVLASERGLSMPDWRESLPAVIAALKQGGFLSLDGAD